MGCPALAQILPPGATPTKLATGYAFTEGALLPGSLVLLASGSIALAIASRILPT